MTANTDPAAGATPVPSALAQAVVEIERHVASGGWDGPVRVFALVRTASALAAEPALAGQLPPEVLAAASADPEHLTSVEQEGLPASDDLEGLLGAIAWPETVDGAAITVERVVLPPEAEESLPEDPQQAVAALMAHPDRQDVRLAVGVLRDGSSWCAIRQRALDADQAVGQGPDAVPGLIEALRATLA
ncbi:PPA1309 family protein [Cellulomonas denverensis]|uniref:PPA1309 family protein n=1 Tax=Cellulomonas denverensis TaxID=264297 RepID=UPI001A3710C7|nr:PPA1309 family protein [Cellulomonas denverensis]GIG26328.1 hypothetical protein Cde04nite_25720 [Cellulomonas denverensis]